MTSYSQETTEHLVSYYNARIDALQKQIEDYKDKLEFVEAKLEITINQ